MAVTAEPGDENAASRNTQDSILSAKVSRALEVRSDTPAMKAALDALAHLPDHQDDLFSVDSRSVRVAIEQDALQQALLLQDELRSLLSTVSELRQGVSDMSAIARRVEDTIHTNVMVSTGISGTVPGREAEVSADNIAAGTAGRMHSGDEDALEQEQRLASMLNDAFAQHNAAKKRVDAVHAFLEKFDLSEEDSRLLDHYDFEDVESSNVNGTAFLNALERVRLIRKELGRTFGTTELLHIETQQSKLEYSDECNRLGASSALRMMESLAQKQERAYERLYHWMQKYLHVHDHASTTGNSIPPQEDDMLDEALTHPFVRRSLSTLRNVPAFYSHLLELIAVSRRSEETRRFLVALTSGYGGLPPIEMRAHDAVAYTGDMLAFCFRAFSVEADVARGLLNSQPEADESRGIDEEKSGIELAEKQDAEDVIDKPMTPAEMLSQSMGGVSRPLKSRILQVISSLSRRPEDDDQSDDELDDGVEEEGSATRNRLSQLCDICGLLLFYSSALDKGLAKLSSPDGRDHFEGQPEEKNPLLVVILECLDEAANAYEASLRVYGAMLEQLSILTGDSEASSAHAMLVRLVDVRRASPGFVSDVTCPDFCRHILSLDFACSVLIEAALPNCRRLDDTVSLRQAIAVARKGDLSSEVSSTLEQQVHDQEKALIDVLVDKETSDVMDLCGLGTLVSAWERFKGVQVEGMTMATHPGLTPDEAQNAMKEFYASLFSPPLPSFESTIKDPSLRKLARSKIAKNVCMTYASLHAEMTKPEGGYDGLGFLAHTPTQVSTLFTV